MKVACFALRRSASALLVLVAITYFAFLAQEFAYRTQFAASSSPWRPFQAALRDTAQLPGHLLHNTLGGPRGPSERLTTRSALVAWADPLLNSLGLLTLAMALGGLVGGLLGTLTAARRRRGAAMGLVLLSIIGVSTPSFFLGMLLQGIEIALYRATGLRLVPIGGFGWDSHLVLPVLVLAARPIAQVARLTHVQLSDILAQDYVRTAYAKGLRPRRVWGLHIVPNAANAVLTALAMSLRLALSSLPVVEVLFGWPGAGRGLLEALRTYQADLATLFVVVLGALFVGLNLLLEIAYRLVDPRLREQAALLQEGPRWREWLCALLSAPWRRRRARCVAPHHPRRAGPRGRRAGRPRHATARAAARLEAGPGG
jgi:peptide/nickel transport system permease protein